MPTWLLPILQLLPALIQAIAGAIKSNPPPATASAEVLESHVKACEACDAMSAHMSVLTEHLDTLKASV